VAADSIRFDDVTPILSVDDVDAALAWHEGALGFARAWTWGEPVELASVCREHVELNLGLRGKVGPPGPSQVYLRVAPIDAVWALVQAAGAEIVTPIGDRAYGMRDFSIRDPSGNRLDFGEAIGDDAQR